MSSTSRTKRIFYPPRTFDEDLRAFVDLAKELGWQFSGVDLDQLNDDALEQVAERGRLDEAEGQYIAVRARFAEAQESRYRRFAAALNAARAAFENHTGVVDKLRLFVHSRVRSVASGTLGKAQEASGADARQFNASTTRANVR